MQLRELLPTCACIVDLTLMYWTHVALFPDFSVTYIHYSHMHFMHFAKDVPQ